MHAAINGAHIAAAFRRLLRSHAESMAFRSVLMRFYETKDDVAGNNPDKKTIFGSYSDDLGVRTNTELQRIYSTDTFKGIFPGTRISEAHTISDRWKRNDCLLYTSPSPRD